MGINIIKLGGTVLATLKDREYCLQKLNLNKTNNKIIIVVSAMGRSGFPYSTDTLDSLAKNVSNSEKDRLLSCGEIISSVVFSDFLKEKGFSAQSVSYLDIGITAHKENNNLIIDDINNVRLNKLFDLYDILVVPGFIGKSLDGEIITLGRGSSDLTAIIMAKMFGVNEVDLFKDVSGVYPFIHFPLKNYIPYDYLSYLDMEMLIDSGSKIVSKDALLYAKNNNIIINVLPYNSSEKGTKIGNYKTNYDIVGFFVKEKTFDIISYYPCRIKNEMNDLFLSEHLIIKKDYIDGNHYYFKLESSQLLLAKRILIKKYFQNFVKIKENS